MTRYAPATASKSEANPMGAVNPRAIFLPASRDTGMTNGPGHLPASLELVTGIPI